MQTRRERWRGIAWSLGVVATVLNGFVVGYGAIWFQLFGDTADASDYRVSAGGYGAAAVVLALAVPALLVGHRSRWLVGLTLVSAGVLALLSAGSLVTARQLPSEWSNSVWDGVGGVVWAPWTWVMVWLGVLAVVRRIRARRSTVDEPGGQRAAV